MASARAQEVAEALWEMKRAGKVGLYQAIAKRCGFASGSGGRTMITTMKTVRRDWPHLQWWRAIPDHGLLVKGSEQAQCVEEDGFVIVDTDKRDPKAEEEIEMVTLEGLEEHLMIWPDEEADAAAAALAEAGDEDEEEESVLGADDDDDDE
jgi:alkylated DNA nucleotide flippase Atl1